MKRLVEFEPMAHTLYEKQDKRFVPVASHIQRDYLREGDYHVSVGPNVVSIIRLVHPRNIVETEAALIAVKEAMCRAMIDKQNEPQNPKPKTPAQIRAWKRFCKLTDVERVWLPCIEDVVQAGLDVVRKRLNYMKGAS